MFPRVAEFEIGVQAAGHMGAQRHRAARVEAPAALGGGAGNAPRVGSLGGIHRVAGAVAQDCARIVGGTRPVGGTAARGAAGTAALGICNDPVRRCHGGGILGRDEIIESLDGATDFHQWHGRGGVRERFHESGKVLDRGVATHDSLADRGRSAELDRSFVGSCGWQ